MKRCPACNRTFEDTLTYCLIDGSILSAPFDPHATLVIPEPTHTEPPPTEVLKLAETRQEISPTIVTPQPERKSEELASIFATPVPAFESPGIRYAPLQAAPKPTRWLPIVGVIAALIILATVAAFYFTQRGEPQVADVRLPDIEFTTLEGDRFRLSQLRGKVVALNFWATWCVPCREQIPVLNDIRSAFEQRGLSVVGVSSDDTIESIKRFQSDVKQNYTLLLGDKTLPGQFGEIVTFPTTLIIDRNGRIREKIMGYADRPRLEEAIKKLLD